MKFTKLQRLIKADEFSSVFNYRCFAIGDYIKIYVFPNQLTHSRLGLIVSKKIHKRANKRNYMKRVLREIFRNTLIQHNLDMVIQVKKLWEVGSFNEILNEYEFLHNKLSQKISKYQKR